MFCPQFIPDLPFNSGVPGCFEVRCPEATIVNARRPAPVGAGHVHVAMNVSEIMLQCVRLAVAAATEAPFPTARVQGWNGISGIALSSWGGVGLDGKPDGWMFLEGTLTGSPGGWGRDGVDAHHFVVPTQGVDADGVPPKSADIEIMESWHPILITGRKIRTGSGGAGRWRAGSGLEIQFELQGTTRLIGQMIGLRPRVPIEGVAGGLPGDRSEFVRIDADGTSESIRLDAADVVVGEGQSFIIRAASGGGVGDPLDRPVEVVAEDVRNGILTTADALDAYGVLLHSSGSPDNEASVARRDQVRRQRLARATPPAIPVDPSRTGGSSGQLAQPLYPGIAQRGPVAFAEESGAPLAVAPDHWTDGCPVLEEFVPGDGPPVVVRSYLDPISGRLLHVEAVPHGVGRAFDVLPERWTAATG
jgi:N-methylhydantoinase B